MTKVPHFSSRERERERESQLQTGTTLIHTNVGKYAKCPLLDKKKNNVTAPTLSPDATMNSSFFEVLFRDGGENVVYIHNRYLTCM